jgi:hypothetical protein
MKVTKTMTNAEEQAWVEEMRARREARPLYLSDLIAEVLASDGGWLTVREIAARLHCQSYDVYGPIGALVASNRVVRAHAALVRSEETRADYVYRVAVPVEGSEAGRRASEPSTGAVTNAVHPLEAGRVESVLQPGKPLPVRLQPPEGAP